MKKGKVLGIDIGGSGVKGGIVDLAKGELVSERIRVPTPKSRDPNMLIDAIAQIVDAFEWKGKIGCGFPGVVRSQIIETAANLTGKKIIGTNLAEEIGRRTNCDAWIINDADAAGIAEMQYGAGKDIKGLVLMLTVGTGIGTALFQDGVLVPNLEFGHLKMRDKLTSKNVDAEKIYSDAIRKANDLTWRAWTERFNKYLRYVQALCWPDLIILGGGIASKKEKFFKYIDVDCDVITAKLENRAGIIGAAYMASEKLK
ncbi:MAG: ROK family protein [Opitutales bacterium]|nr:ROK family protein [Opitutales bacterium]